MRALRALLLASITALPAAPALAEAATSGSVGTVRLLDRLTGSVTDLDMRAGDLQRFGRLAIEYVECRYPTDNPSGDAYVLVIIRDGDPQQEIFRGWMVASAPALNPLEHYRYDVWALRCSNS